MEKRIGELEESVKTLARYMKSELQRLENMKKIDRNLPVESKISMLAGEVEELKKMLERSAVYSLKENELHAAREDSLGDMLEELEPLEKKIEKELRDEDVERISMEKNISDIKQQLAGLEKRTRDLDEAQYTEKNVEKMCNRFLSAGLAKFSSDLDRLYPALATRTDFERFSVQMQRKIDSIEVPDLSHIERKVKDLEDKVLRLINIVEDIYNRLPAVVE